MARRRSLAPDDSLFHVSQRLDALAADDEHAYLYFSRVLTPPADARDLSGDSSHSDGRRQQQHQQHHQQLSSRIRAGTLTARRRRRRKAFWSRLLGLSAFYARFACLIGLGWFATAYATVATSSLVRLTPTRLLAPAPDSPDSQAFATEMAHEFGALAAGALLGGLLFGSLGDHYGRRRVLLAASFCGAAAQLLTGFVWAHAALLAARALHGLGLGGQIVLFPIVLSEFAAQRSRGRIVVFGLAFLPLGALSAIHTAHRLAEATSWTLATSGVGGGLETLFLLALLVFLRDSPRFLAAIGRAEVAMRLVEAIESAHGINRNARVTMPSSLFEPPVHPQQSTPARTSNFGLPHERSLYSQSPHVPSHSNSGTATPTATATPTPGPRRRRTSAALTPGMVSIGVSLGKRWRRVLFCRPYALRSLGLTLLWLIVSGGLSFTVAATSRFPLNRTRHVASLLSTYVSIAGCVGLLFSAAVIDRYGRVPTVLMTLLVSSLATTCVGINLYMTHPSTAFLSISCSLLALVCVVTVCTAVVWTLESYGVLIRATGMGLAFSGICLGVGAGQWLAWTSWLDDNSVYYVLWAVAALFLVLAFVTWRYGGETRGLEDVDSVVTSEISDLLTSGAPFERDSSEKLPPIRGTYHSKDTTYEDQDTVTTDDNHPGFPPLPSGTSQTSTFIGSSGSRTSSARFSSVRFSSQRTLSSARSASRSSRGSSLSRQQSGQGASSFRKRDGSLSARGDVPILGARRPSRGDHTPPFVIRRSSLVRSTSAGAYSEAHAAPAMRRSSSRSQHEHRRLQDQTPRRSFGSTRVSFSELTTSLPGRLDPHSVREHLGRRSSQADRSSSSSGDSDSLGLDSDHDVLSIDIDPFADDDHEDSFVTLPTPMPMLG